MEVREVSAKEYSEVIQTPYHVYLTGSFNSLNGDKCEEVFYLLFREGKYRLGLVVGRKDTTFYSPFSAPFGGYSFIAGDIRLQYIEDSIRILKTWVAGKKLLSIIITLPPPIYNNDFIAKQVNCFWREKFEISTIDLNYSFDIKSFKEDYPERIWHNARKNLKIALNAGLQFRICSTEQEKMLAYEIININRRSHEYPLHMSWKQISDTIRIITADFFIVYSDDMTPVASAIVFHVSMSVVQVIYWGDLPGYSELRPMNYLSFKIFEFYKVAGMNVVDIGPSTENSIPNFGLCEFKESIGCSITQKLTLTFTL
jgi:hypothetical protein